MTEETFKRELRKVAKSNDAAMHDRRDYVSRMNPKVIDAIIMLTDRNKKGLDIDDWECWLGNIIFK